MTAVAHRRDASATFGIRPRAGSRTDVYDRAVDDELTRDQEVALGVVCSEADRRGREEGARIADDYLAAQIILAQEDGRPVEFVARLDAERDEIRLRYRP